MGAIGLIDANLLTLDGANLLALDTRLTLDTGRPLAASEAMLNRC